MKKCSSLFMALAFFTCLIALVSASLSCAETLTSPGGTPVVLLFKSKADFQYFIKECNGRAFANDCVYCLAGIADVGTRVSILQGSSWTFKKIRLMNGPKRGLVGWVPMEMVK